MGGTIFHAFVKFELKKKNGARFAKLHKFIVIESHHKHNGQKIHKIVLNLFVKLGIGPPSPMDRLTIRQIQI